MYTFDAFIQQSSPIPSQKLEERIWAQMQHSYKRSLWYTVLLWRRMVVTSAVALTLLVMATGHFVAQYRMAQQVSSLDSELLALESDIASDPFLVESVQIE